MVQLSLTERVTLHIFRYYVSIIAVIIFAFVKPFYLLGLYLVRKCLPKEANSVGNHAKKVESVRNQILDWISTGRKTKLCTARPGWRAISLRFPLYKDTMTGIDLSHLADVITINLERMTVSVEPLTTMGRLTEFLTRNGWTIPVVPELPFLTVGGLICGAGLETSSHKYGLLHNTCVSYEFVLCSGEVVKCSKDENTDLFHAIPGSHGTLGFLTSVEIKIIPAKKYVKLEYIPVHSLDMAVDLITKVSLKQPPHEFVEGLMFDLNKGVIMIGNMTSEVERNGKINRMGRWYKEWFHKHAEKFINSSNTENSIEYIPLRDYYHRHSQSIFWLIQNYVPYGNSILFRYLLGWIAIKETNSYKLTPSPIRRLFEMNQVVQDFIVPIEKVKEALLFSHEEVEVYPIWLCPVKMINMPGGVRFKGKEDEMYMDVGVYGNTRKPEKYEIEKSTKAFEQFCLRNRCYQALYADVFLTRDEFQTMFDPSLYFKVRNKLKCEEAFPDIFEKVCRAARK